MLWMLYQNKIIWCEWYAQAHQLGSQSSFRCGKLKRDKKRDVIPARGRACLVRFAANAAISDLTNHHHFTSLGHTYLLPRWSFPRLSTYDITLHPPLTGRSWGSPLFTSTIPTTTTTTTITTTTMFAATPIRLAGYPGFFRRSMDEFKRQAKFAVKMEGLHIPIKPYPLIKFDEKLSPERCKIMCDSDVGGFSRASLTYVDGAEHMERTIGEGESDSKKGGVIISEPGKEPSHAVFKGTISTDLPQNRPQIQRSGYAGFRTRDRGLSLFGKLLWDLSPYSYLALRIKSDGRKYFVNFQTESIVPTDLHQHLLPSSTPGEWETVTIPFSAFVRTNYGQVVEPQREMMSTKVRSVGISLIDRVPGQFELAVADIYATNRAPERKSGQQEETGFDLSLEPEEDVEQGRGIMDEVEPKRKKGEPERILI